MGRGAVCYPVLEALAGPEERWLVMFDRIVSDPSILGGKPCIKGSRIVEFLLELVAEGADREEILRSYPHLTAQDVEQALRYAARFLSKSFLKSSPM
jgi:uncharacterized protein (DUF433 family)